jgi:hypothetical protein
MWYLDPRYRGDAGEVSPRYRPTGPGAELFMRSGPASHLRLYAGRHWADATAGDFLFVLEGGIRAFGKESEEPASLLLFAPGAHGEGTSRGWPGSARSSTRVAGRVSSSATTRTGCDGRCRHE